MATIGEKIDGFFIQKLWKTDAPLAGKARSLEIKASRLIYIAIKGFSEEQLILRAMSLVYTTLLSFVPLLAVSFSVLKAFGVHTRFLIFLYYFLEPLGDNGVELSMKIIGFVENVKIGVLGSIGLSALMYTVISTVQKIESALNYIWNIKGTRGLSQRFSNYMSVLLVGPVLIFSALGITTSLMSSTIMKKIMAIQMLGPVIYMISRLAPYLFISAAFTVIYMLLPNTRVRFRSALAGGIAAGILWQTIGWIFTSFIASSAQYSAIYSGFATLILFLIWLYWNFLTLLIGARVSFYMQHPQQFDPGRKVMTLSDRLKEKLALAIMFLVGQSFLGNHQHWHIASLTQKLGMPLEFVHEVLTILQERGLLVPTSSEPSAYLPAKDLETITLHEIISAIRISGEDADAASRLHASIPEIDELIKHIEDAITLSLDRQTLKDLVLAADKQTG
ncbi:MAG: YihY family inner membrane protein [Nitrospirae bacterium]|nr:YihY family inner membrane protein [Nitrospirota bacterium]